MAPENRETIFRYDDTNPEAESKEYIDSLRFNDPPLILLSILLPLELLSI